MSCNLKATYWDFSVTEKESSLDFAPILCFGSETTEEECVADWKLGNSGESSHFLENNYITSLMDSSASGSFKRVRANKDILQVPSCLVDGCVADLSKCREYHRRHRVCEAHSKTSIVKIGCQEQRFCQQCSRFHSLSEFDESKRSCRKRLDGHNRRRRKPQPHSLFLNSPNHIPSHQGSTIISYGTQYFRDDAEAASSWNEDVKVQNNHLFTLNTQLNCKINNFPNSFSQGYSGEKQFPFLQNSAHLNTPDTTFGISGSSSNHKLLISDGFERVPTNSNRASSLLSSSQANTFGFSPAHFVQLPTQPSNIPSTHYNSLPMESGAAMYSSSLSANRNNNSFTEFPEMNTNDSNNCQQTITFSWG